MIFYIHIINIGLSVVYFENSVFFLFHLKNTTNNCFCCYLAVSIVSNGEGGCRLINDDTYLCARADMRDFHVE